MRQDTWKDAGPGTEMCAEECHYLFQNPDRSMALAADSFCCCKLLIFLRALLTLSFGLMSACISGISGYWPAMQPNSQERRTMRRFDMRLPAVVKVEGSDGFYTETQNVSARGVFFYLQQIVPTGTKIEVTLTFPPHVTLTDSVRIRFNARVIRVENPLPSARVGVAAMIEDYEFLRSGGSDFLSALQKGMQDH